MLWVSRLFTCVYDGATTPVFAETGDYEGFKGVYCINSMVSKLC